ncbi:hypothetical protein ETD83_10845 [Actinomadura soli]|uniref:Core-binding (CB) domain-containing protein n=1 Tax=Actinomadura soli TaxID=2508997 RepID=A0A5C4JF23_9ACTN|nr:site-specific integrase [Actinomadura soli]TMR03395.1 hypothetical protein ETD83_10845 [Actinomadura soli]
MMSFAASADDPADDAVPLSGRVLTAADPRTADPRILGNPPDGPDAPGGAARSAAGQAGALAVAAPVPLTGRAPARTPRELAELMRAHGFPEAALQATAAWLSGERRSSPRTQAGYARDLAWWLTYAAARNLDPVDVPPAEADLYAAALRAAGLADATRARRLSAASSWYGYLTRTRGHGAQPVR